MDEELTQHEVQVERKVFYFALRQNPRGRFLRITEDVGGRRDTIIIPATGLRDIRTALDHMIETDQAAGPLPPPLPT